MCGFEEVGVKKCSCCGLCLRVGSGCCLDDGDFVVGFVVLDCVVFECEECLIVVGVDVFVGV